MEIKESTLIQEIINSGEYQPFDTYFWSYITEDHLQNSLEKYGFQKHGFIDCFRHMKELKSVESSAAPYFIYSAQEIYIQHDKQEAKLFYFPVEAGEPKPYALIIPGGAFARQWGLIEGFAIATELNKLGVPAFVLFYRTAQDGVIQKAIEDMHRSIAFIEENTERFHVKKSHYMVGGFSAGGTLTSELMSSKYGWKSAGLPKPELLLLGYVAVSMELFYKAWKSFPAGHPMHDGAEPFLRRISGKDITLENLNAFNPLLHTSQELCPPLYITANEDDPTVPFENSLQIQSLADKLHIPYRTKFGKIGGHSFGLGKGTEVDGWLQEVVQFWSKLNS